MIFFCGCLNVIDGYGYTWLSWHVIFSPYHSSEFSQNVPPFTRETQADVDQVDLKRLRSGRSAWNEVVDTYRAIVIFLPAAQSFIPINIT